MSNTCNTEVIIQKNEASQTLTCSVEAESKIKANQIILEKFNDNAVKSIHTVKSS